MQGNAYKLNAVVVVPLIGRQGYINILAETTTAAAKSLKGLANSLWFITCIGEHMFVHNKGGI